MKITRIMTQSYTEENMLSGEIEDFHRITIVLDNGTQTHWWMKDKMPVSKLIQNLLDVISSLVSYTLNDQDS